VNDRFDDESSSAEDAALLERLRAALGPEPLPEGLLARAEGLFAFRDADRELLELLQEAAAEPAGLRGGPGAPGRLTFELEGGAVSVEVVLERDALRGQVVAGTVTEVGLERLAEEVRAEPVDPLGQFSFADPAPGPARLRLRGGGARPMTTDWFVL
jgi:hypothetical protein